jgi:ABC-type sulfate/molybdate transport systems ATPase subunit
MSLAPRSNAVTVLLGATQAGKTSLMRIMAGLDAPSTGRVLVDGKMWRACRCVNAMWPWCTSSSSTTRR